MTPEIITHLTKGPYTVYMTQRIRYTPTEEVVPGRVVKAARVEYAYMSAYEIHLGDEVVECGAYYAPVVWKSDDIKPNSERFLSRSWANGEAAISILARRVSERNDLPDLPGIDYHDYPHYPHFNALKGVNIDPVNLRDLRPERMPSKNVRYRVPA